MAFFNSSYRTLRNLISSRNIDQSWNTCYQTIPEFMQSNSRTKRITIREYQPWFSSDLMHIYKRLKRYHRADPKAIKYLYLKKSLRTRLRKAKMNYENNLLHTNRTKQFHKYISGKFRYDLSIGRISYPDTKEVITDDQDKCDLFNQFFASVYGNRTEFIVTYQGECPIIFTYESVAKATMEMNKNCSAGADKIPMLFLEELNYSYFRLYSYSFPNNARIQLCT